MKKSLIALAALASISAFAQTAAPAPAPTPAPITVYGLIDYGLAGGTGASAAFLPDNNSVSRFGIKGTIAGGNGVNVNYNLEAGSVVVFGRSVTTTTTSATQNTYTSTSTQAPLFNRAAWAGFSGNFGEIRAGTQWSLGFQENIGFDLNGAADDSWAAGLAGVPTLGFSGAYGTNAGSLAQYISPTFAGFTLQVGYQPQRDSAALLGQANNALSAGAAGLSFATGPFAAAVTYEGALTTGTGMMTDNNYTSASASYDFGVAKLVGTYANAGTGYKGYSMGGQVTLAGVNVGVQYAKNTDTTNAGTELFANKEILKNVTAYMDYGNTQPNGGSSTYLYSVGAIWAF